MANRTVNKVILVGNLAADPVTRYTSTQKAVTNIRLGTNKTWKDRDGNKHEKVEWHNVVLFNKLGEIAGEYLTKGASVFIEGELQTRKWRDKEGRDQYTTEVVASDMKMLGGGRRNGAVTQGRSSNESSQAESEYEAAGADDFDFPPELQ